MSTVSAFEPQADNFLRFVVPNLSQMGAQGVLSPPKVIGQFQWWLYLRPVPMYKSVWRLTLFCEKNARLWECVVQPKWYVRDQTTGSRFSHELMEENEVDVILSHESRSIQLCQMNAAKFSQGCFKDDSMQLVVKIVVKEQNPINRECRVNFFKPSHLFNVALKLDDGTMYSNKHYLSLHSDVFNALFFGVFKEANQNEVEMKDVDLGIFHSIMCMLYQLGEGSITHFNAEDHLEMADRFDLKVITKKCEEFLKRNAMISDMDRVMIADRFRLDNLLTFSMDRLKLDAVKKMKEVGDYDLLSPDGQSKFAKREAAVSRTRRVVPRPTVN